MNNNGWWESLRLKCFLMAYEMFCIYINKKYSFPMGIKHL